MLHVVLMGVQYLCAFLIIALVLLQRGKGADAGAGFGAGASGTVFGARGASTALSRATAILAAVFMVTSLSLAYASTHKAVSSRSVLDQLSTQPAPPVLPARPSQAAPASPAVPASPAAPASGNGVKP